MIEILHRWSNGASCTLPHASLADLQGLLQQFGAPEDIVFGLSEGGIQFTQAGPAWETYPPAQKETK